MNDMVPKHKILIVDDVPTNITVLTEILMSKYKMICATNGLDALKVVASSSPDLILLDIMMPDMDGYEVCRRLQDDANTKNIPVIFLTAKSEEEDETKGLEIGAVDYISKPFSPAILKNKIRIHLELKQHRDHLEELVRSRTLQITKSNEKLQQEIAERVRAQDALKESEEQYRIVFENTATATAIIEKDYRISLVNSEFESLTKYPREEIENKMGLGQFASKNDPSLMSEYDRILEIRSELIPRACETELVDSSGITKPIYLSLSALPGTECGVISIIDLSSLKIAQDAFTKQRAYFLQLFESSPQAILFINTDGKIVEINKSFEDLFGYKVEEIKGQYNKHITVPEDLISEDEVFHRNILARKIISKETYRENKNGNLIPVSILGYPIEINDQVEGLFIIYTDISQRKDFEAQLQHQAFHDSLTGIPNRILLLERLERALERSRRREEYTFSVLMVDLDRFKAVNDSLGHLAGDQLLKKISSQIQDCIRATDTIARLGGDEFAILIEEFKDPKEVFQIAKRIQSVAEASYIIERNEVCISASIGIVLETKSYKTAENILRDADIAMYRAKESGKASFKVFNKKMHEVAVESLKIENELRRAIQKDELTLYYQPIMDIKGSTLLGFEALVRWIHPDKGVIVPDKFIPIAEETGLIIPLGHMVIKKACRQLKEWQKTYPKVEKLTMSVNISVKQFMQVDLTDYISKTLHENNLKPDCLKVEITESLLMKQTKSMIDKLNTMKDIGIEVVLDDFGTGYSSLSYIQQFPIDNIKIDRSFIKGLDSETEEDSREIVKTIINLSKSLGLGVVAEGVERESQLDLLQSLKCDSVQGFYFSKPVDKNAAAELIKQYL